MAGRVVYSGGIVKNGLVLNLDVAKGYPKDGDVIYDLNNQQFNGDLVNNPTYDWENYGTIYFDGNSTSCTIQNSENLSNDYFTINLFLKTSPASNDSYLLSKQYDTGYGTYWFEEYVGNIRFFVGTTVSYYGITYAGVNREEWYYFTGIYENNRMYLYVNGDYYASGTTIGSLRNRTDTTGVVSVGRYGSLFAPPTLHTSLYFTNFSFYNVVLTPNEIAQNYNALKGRYGL